MEKVSVNKGLLIGVVAVAAVSLIALAFLLGRSSEYGGPSRQPPGGERPARGVAPASPPTPTAAITDHADTRPAFGTVRFTPEQRVAPQAGSGDVLVPADGERGSGGTDSARAAVAAYFDAVDHIQAANLSGEAEGLANEMAAALARGDTSGLDQTIRETEAAKETLAGLTPPASCAAHHRESVASLDDALEILRSLKTAMESPEPANQLAGISARATALRSRVDALQKEERALRQRFGLTH